MTKSKTKTKSSARASRRTTVMPHPPVIYINDGVSPDAPESALALFKLLPKYSYSAVTESYAQNAAVALLNTTEAEGSVAVFISTQPYASSLVTKNRNDIQQSCIKHGRKLLTINLYESGSTAPKTTGAQYLAYAVQNDTTPETVSRHILKWIFETLAPLETLHLISDSELKAIDKTNFPDYEYCPLSESRLRPKDAKLQFVAVITSKAVVDPAGDKLTWSVADKTGIANFYFQHRGPSSQYTWDWVLALQPGQRVALPRMPSIKLRDPLPTRALKAPLKIIGFSLLVPAAICLVAGKGLHKAAKKVRRSGRGAKWVKRADVVVDGTSGKVRERLVGEGVLEEGWEERARKVRDEKMGGEGGGESGFRVFDEKGLRSWDCGDEDARTEKGSVAGSEAERCEKEDLLA